jgi:hypothetical protein
MQKMIGWLCCILIALGATGSLHAQGTAFTYQGRLNNGGNPASGNYDLTFALYGSTNQAGPVIAGPITNSAVAVTNGLFTTLLNFGSGVFAGNNYWLGVGVRTNGGTTFTPLLPFQPLTPTPYAIFANTASNLSGTLPAAQLSGALPATQLSGTLPSAQISGTYSQTVTFNNGANNFAGTFSGNGPNLANLNASQLTSGTVADARLTTNVALLNANQTFTGSSTFTNLYGNSFSGSFFGNGLVGWTATNGTAVQAQIDHGYLLTNSLLTRVTLPATPNVGDIVRISGAGAGGWFVVENSGQSVLGNFASYRNIFQTSPASPGNYLDVAASVNGIRMYAVGNGVTGVYASSDSGLTWGSVGGLSGFWQSVACSANGQIVYAVSSVGSIQKSSNSGTTWSSVPGSTATIACTADGSQPFTGGIACSGDGTRLAKLVSGAINVSTNAGSSYFSIPGPVGGLTCLAVSSDCTRLVAGVNGGLLYASANLGATWTSITTTNQYWSGAWMSEDGNRITATVVNNGAIGGGIYIYGVNVLPGTISTNSSIAGSQGSAVELQYVGNGRFMPVSSTGTIWAN